MQRVLFICEGNIHRSRTAEVLYGPSPGLEVRSAGLADSARVQVTDELLAWADLIFVMEQRLVRLVRRRFPGESRGLICLEIPDDYQFQQPELRALLAEKLEPYLGKPVVSEKSG
jgi:predicted protein tyrosine phosphatase